MNKIDIFKSEYNFNNCEYDKEVKTSMGVGGKVLALCCPENEYQVIDCIKAAEKAELPVYVCGNLSNTIIKDGGYCGVILRMSDNYSGYKEDNGRFIVKSGTSMIKLAKELTEKGYGGLEFAGGIPGTVGGGIRMNAGAYGGQLSDVVKGVTYYDGEKLVTVDKAGFGYRKSIFADMDKAVILEAVFELEGGSGSMEKLKEFNRKRAEKQPLDKPNCGSVFKRPKDGFAAKIIEECGLKGTRVGGAAVSEKHSGFIVNDNQASAKDVLALMEQVKTEVNRQTGILLENEWVIIGED